MLEGTESEGRAVCGGFAIFCCILGGGRENGYIRHEGTLLHFVEFLRMCGRAGGGLGG